VAVLVAVRPYVAQCTVIVAEDYLRRSRVKAWLIRNLIGAEPFDRYGDFRESLARARDLVGVRRPLLVFPEGTRSLTGHLQTFKPGVGLLSLELDLPVVPVHLDGAGQALPRGHRWPRRVPIRLCFGPSLEPASSASSAAGRYESYRALAEQVRRAVESLAPIHP
jgi:1-acyl-sn-glycerol-3-phosphate acyltransferase